MTRPTDDDGLRMRALVAWLHAQYETYIDEANELDQGSTRWASKCARAETLLHVLDKIDSLDEGRE